MNAFLRKEGTGRLLEYSHFWFHGVSALPFGTIEWQQSLIWALLEDRFFPVTASSVAINHNFVAKNPMQHPVFVINSCKICVNFC